MTAERRKIHKFDVDKMEGRPCFIGVKARIIPTRIEIAFSHNEAIALFHDRAYC